ncbi:serine hydrolase [Rhodococcus sp. NPDC127530]|uniref:serine hydrolase n=1 Tax=unclassified Rhodococcus (in: high G+C Gram-positive bacteria) TaxID=192944 RepID=UPI0036335292
MTTSCRRLAAQQPRWAPGREAGYQAQNYGHVIGELVRRTTGLSLGSFMRTELVDPACADFRLGAPDIDPQRIAELVGPETVRMSFPPDLDRKVMVDAFTAPRVDTAEAMTTWWRAAELGAANGHGHARSVATLLSV